MNQKRHVAGKLNWGIYFLDKMLWQTREEAYGYHYMWRIWPRVKSLIKQCIGWNGHIVCSRRFSQIPVITAGRIDGSLWPAGYYWKQVLLPLQAGRPCTWKSSFIKNNGISTRLKTAAWKAYHRHVGNLDPRWSKVTNVVMVMRNKIHCIDNSKRRSCAYIVRDNGLLRRCLVAYN